MKEPDIDNFKACLLSCFLKLRATQHISRLLIPIIHVDLHSASENVLHTATENEQGAPPRKSRDAQGTFFVLHLLRT